MSEDQKHDRDGGRDDADGLFSKTPTDPGGDDGGTRDGPVRGGKADKSDKGAKSDKGERGERVGMPAPVDDDAIAKHRAAKEARIRKRMEDKRVAAGEGPEGRQGPGARKGGQGGGQGGGAGGKSSALPALRPDLKADTPALRAERVEAIRRDLVRRRRRKGGGLLIKLWLFVLVPTALVAYFMWFKASELYKSESQFMVQSAEGGGAPGGLLGQFLGGAGGAFDPNAVHSFVQSRDVLRLLDRDHAWIAHFQDPELDFFHGLAADATFEDAYSHYTQMIQVSFDPTEGILEMAMVAGDPETAQRFSNAVIGYAEDMVNKLSERIQADAVVDADRNLADAEERLREAQEAVAELQKTLATFTVEGEVTAEMSIISSMEVELEALRARLTNLRRVTSESDPRVERIRNQVATLEAQVQGRRDNMTGNGTPGDVSLADVNLQLTKARFEVEAASAIFAAAVERREVAYANARRQSRYLELVSAPSVPDEVNYPKKLETTALAFLAFLGFYIVGSLTVSLIREQASI